MSSLCCRAEVWRRGDGSDAALVILSLAFTRSVGCAICSKTGFFPPIQVERLGTSSTDVPKFVLTYLVERVESPEVTPTLLLLPHTVDFRFYIQHDLDSSRDPNLGEPLFSRYHRSEVLERPFKLFGIPTFPILYVSFHRFLTMTKGFSFPFSKNLRVEQRVNASLYHGSESRFFPRKPSCCSKIGFY
ncbi:hypothetical protein AVEN_221633-1 [Araneus ventricosus]|uniref:Uncharacterized protein n=1 Tax=Araneus ventricosus TaxID=182803 RepID=A0A4Y2SV62_ARAVE|nr:hypothetical protein AVEN_261509-1 [Araneus ventricosus]GBN91872.1 hypothetical protein AVEN_221633-1 [Araneus ventricosus]